MCHLPEKQVEYTPHYFTSHSYLIPPLSSFPINLLWPYHQPANLFLLWLSLGCSQPWAYKGGNSFPHQENGHYRRNFHFLFYKVYLCFGLYDKIILDHGPQFTSAFAKELRKFLNYDLSLSTTYYPQFNREAKWVNQEIETYLRIFCGSNPAS